MQPRAAGYTLVELLVVLLVLGLCAGLVHALASPGDDARVHFESERLAQLLTLASTQARLGGSRVSWTSDGTAYRFHYYDDHGYARETVTDDPLRPRTLSHGVAISDLRVDGLRPRSMRIDFMPHAPPPVFELDLRLGPASTTVRGSALGQIETYAHARPR